MEILSDKFLNKYRKKFESKLNIDLEKINSNSPDNNFDYYLKSSAVYSSNIEGNPVDLNSYMNSKLFKKKLRNKAIEEIDDLLKAYNFTKDTLLTEKNLLKSHKIFSKQFIIKSKQGNYRKERIGVFDSGGLVYMAVEPEYVKSETQKVFNDIKYLEKENLSQPEIFYFASFLHLVFAHIHPFTDGNGRAARLLEKWFISMKLGNIAWKIKSERYYFENRSEYYKNINLGPDYYELNYKNCFPFLEMLPKSIL